MTRLIALTAVLMTIAPHAWAETRRFAIVVGENQPLRPGLEPLRYADDDALAYGALLRGAGVQVRVLSVLDDDTQRQHPGLASTTTPPTRRALLSALQDLNEQIRAARSEGAQTDLIFVFAGHAERGPDGEGVMHLRDGTLSRRELLEDIVDASEADFNHLIIDACHAASMVFARGPSSPSDGWRSRDYTQIIDSYLDAADLRSRPNTGVLLASTSTQEAHEWSVFQGGVFSHEVRSALTGRRRRSGRPAGPGRSSHAPRRLGRRLDRRRRPAPPTRRSRRSSAGLGPGC